jgi:REP element-mobilizing transposase RayT
MGRKKKSQEEKDTNRKLRQNRYYARHAEKIKQRNLKRYYDNKHK